MSVLSLGCAKKLVDSEILLGGLKQTNINISKYCSDNCLRLNEGKCKFMLIGTKPGIKKSMVWILLI